MKPEERYFAETDIPLLEDIQNEKQRLLYTAICLWPGNAYFFQFTGQTPEAKKFIFRRLAKKQPVWIKLNDDSFDSQILVGHPSYGVPGSLSANLVRFHVEYLAT